MERAQPLDISFTFSSTVGELGSIIHTLKKYSQILLALVEATGKKKKTTVTAYWHAIRINTHGLGLFNTMLCGTKTLNKNIAIETPKAL